MNRIPQGPLRVVGVVLVMILVLSVKVLVSSRAELADADRASSAGELETAVTHYRRAARWYLPIQPYADRALERLMEIGAQAETDDDSALALASYRSVRAALMSSRSLWIPDRDMLHRADEHIASLMARSDVPALDAHLSEEARAETYLAMLETDRDPAAGWALLALLGFALWILGAYGVFTRALDQDDRFIDGELRRWGTAFVVGMGLFVLGLSLA